VIEQGASTCERVGPLISIRPLAGAEEAERCAHMMAESEPWITLGRGYAAGLAMLSDPTRERHVAMLDGNLAGFAVLLMRGALVGYLQTICVAPEARGSGVGRALMAFAEELVFLRHPNFFLMVSDFNLDAQRFYARLGYKAVGELKDYLAAGRSEVLMRKTRGPMHGYSGPTPHRPAQ